MPSPLPQDTPFAELRYAVQAGANEITWQKRTPISNNERNHAMRLKKLFAYTLPIPLLLTILVYFIHPMLFFDNGTLFLPTVLLLAVTTSSFHFLQYGLPNATTAYWICPQTRHSPQLIMCALKTAATIQKA